MGGHMASLQWAGENGCPWNEDTISLARRKWRTALRESWRLSDGLARKALHGMKKYVLQRQETGDLNVVKWARENGCPWNEPALCRRCCAGKLAGAENGCPWSERACPMLAQSMKWDVLRFAREAGCPWGAETCSMIAGHGNLSVLRWARESGCPMDNRTCMAAATGGHWAVLQWARENGFPWDRKTCFLAVMCNHPHVFRWAATNGCPCDEET
ncbi:unnamed protein product, partial [Scytosiphon promiscuus]